MIGGCCSILFTAFHSSNPITITSGHDTDAKVMAVIIGNYAFGGGGSIVVKGVSIGENPIITAGSVVVKSVPKNLI